MLYTSFDCVEVVIFKEKCKAFSLGVLFDK